MIISNFSFVLFKNDFTSPLINSNSKKTQTDLDINRDWPVFVDLCSKLLNDDGILYFSTNSKKLRFDENLLPHGFTAKDITEVTIPEDFKNKKIHKCWQIKKATE